MNFDLKVNAKKILTETPIWDNRVNKLFWTDLFTGDVHMFDPKTSEDKVAKTDSLIGTAVPCSKEGLLMVAIDSGMNILEFDTQKLELIAQPENVAENRYNDTRVDAKGRIFTSSVSKLYGTDDYRPTMLGKFYMIDTDKSVHVVQSDINQYNAMVWNNENTLLYVIDTFNSNLMAFDYDINSGPKGAPKVALDFEEIGMPDGMCKDVDDNLYVFHWTGKISVCDKSLVLKQIIDFPVEQVCCGGFGGEDMKDLYVATASYGYSDVNFEANPGAGGIFTSKTSVVGAMDNFYIV